MSQTISISELALVVVVENYDPNLMNPSFLNYSGIAPNTWELSKQPIVSANGSQLIYNNGINIIAYPERFMFVENMNAKNISEAEIPGTISRYIETLRNINYKAIGINFRSYITCNEYQNKSNQYVSQNFLKQGEWLEGGKTPVKVGLSLMYELENDSLYLSVNEATMQMPENQQVPVVLFTGNFNYQLETASNVEKVEELQKIINNWQQNAEKYQEVVNKFLKATPETKEVEVTPELVVA